MLPKLPTSFRPLSIAFVTGSGSRRAGGLFHSVRKSALALSAAGHRVTVLTINDALFDEDLDAWSPLKPIAAQPLGPTAVGFAPSMVKNLASDFDVLHQHGIWQAFSTHVAARRQSTGTPVMISPRGMLDPWALAQSGWKKRLAGVLWERANLSAATCLHALNRSEADSIRAFGLGNPIAVIPNGIEIPITKPVAPPPWWPGSRVLLFIGRIHPKKGIAELVEAWARLSRAAPHIANSWYVVIAGWDDGGNQAAIESAIARNGLTGRIIMPGPLHGADKDAALRHAHAFILPSYSEGLPMSVLEAWAFSLPVLMTEACNLPEGFQECAALRISTTPERLAKELEQALESAPERLAAMGRAGHRLVVKRFDWQPIAKQHAEVYSWMLAGVPRSDAPAAVTFA